MGTRASAGQVPRQGPCSRSPPGLALALRPSGRSPRFSVRGGAGPSLALNRKQCLKLLQDGIAGLGIARVVLARALADQRGRVTAGWCIAPGLLRKAGHRESGALPAPADDASVCRTSARWVLRLRSVGRGDRSAQHWGAIAGPHARLVLPDQRCRWRVSRSPASVPERGATTTGVTSQTAPAFPSRLPRSP
jgi:hypothetical protein